MVRVAMLSRWHVHADQYAKQIQENPDARIAAVWDNDAARGAAWAGELGCPFYESYEELLKAPDIDAVAVVSSTNLHPELLIAAARAGKHIYTEKVLAFTAADAMKIRDAVRESGVHFTISFPHKTWGNILLAKKMVENGDIGEITYMRVRNVHGGSICGWLPAYFYDKALCGGGAMMDLGAHPMYLLEWFLGKPEKMASAFTQVTGRGVEDNAVSVMTFKNGAIGVSETGFVSLCDPFTLELSGTQGYIHVQDAFRYRNKASEEKWVTVSELPEKGVMPMDYWISSIVSHTENTLYGIDEAVALSEFMEAAYRSHESGQTIRL